MKNLTIGDFHSPPSAFNESEPFRARFFREVGQFFDLTGRNLGESFSVDTFHDAAVIQGSAEYFKLRIRKESRSNLRAPVPNRRSGLSMPYRSIASR